VRNQHARRLGQLGAQPLGANLGFRTSFCRTRAQGLGELTFWPDGGIWAVEVKRSLSPTLGRGFHSGCADLHPTRKLIVYPGNEPLHVTADVDALPLTTLARELAA
jgi:hypothetical protein